MLKGNTIQIFVEKVNHPSKKVWILRCKIGDCNTCGLKSYNHKPDEDTLKNDAALILKSFQFYHMHLEIPSFNINPKLFETGDIRLNGST